MHFPLLHRSCVLASWLLLTAITTAGPTAPNVIARAAKLYLPVVQVKAATLEETAAYLQRQSIACDPQHKGVQCRVDPSAAGHHRLDLDFQQFSVDGAVRMIAQLTHVQCVATADGYTFTAPTPGAAPMAAGKLTKAEAKGATLVIPVLALEQVTVAAALDSLRATAKTLDPAKQGVNLVLRVDKPAALASISLSLSDVPLTEALRLIGELAQLEMRSDDHTLTLTERR